MREDVRELAERARGASLVLAILTSEQKAEILHRMARRLEENRGEIDASNRLDLAAARKKGLAGALLDRLSLTDKRFSEMVEGVRAVAELPDPVGEVIRAWERPNGLKIRKVRVPLGVVGIIYEARPNVTVDAAALCFRAGNAVILRGGSEARRTNIRLADAMREALSEGGGPEDSVCLIRSRGRAAVREMVRMEGLIDVIIPRGGEGLIRTVTRLATIPVIKHYKGVCHVFVDREAELDMARRIVLNAKCQRPGVCNAVETLLVHESVAARFLPRMANDLRAGGVEVRGCPRTMRIAPCAREAGEDDWFEEYLDLVLSVRVVGGLEEAVLHINRYGSHHSDAIVTEDRERAERFLRGVDSAAVFWNASTRFTDGGQFGLGAEIGISTDKLHARGPMALEELTSYKYEIIGTGQIRE